MWELDYRESWAPKNWCFWTVVLEKTLESPLNCKEVQSVHPKGNQSWIIIWRTDVEAETLILWSPDVKSWLIYIELGMPCNHLILCCALNLLPSIFPSIRVFSNESALCIEQPKHWCFRFNIIPSKEHPGLISFRMDWLDLLAVQGTLKSLLQYHSSKASILWCSGFFIVQLSHPYMTTGKTIALTRWNFVDKVMSLLSNMLSRLHQKHS